MSMLAYLRGLLKRTTGKATRAYSLDERLIFTLKNTAEQQGRSPEEVLDEVVRLGDERYVRQRQLEDQWDSLSPREQETTALICLGYNRNQIAGMLGIAPGTVKTHCESIFRKFDVHTGRHLARLLRDWDLPGWWEQHQT